ncbi:MAG: nucleotidyltransferase domain-containing protein [Nitrospirota bacterium]
MIRYKLIPEDIHQKINSLKGLFTSDSNIVFAYLFGGLLKDKPNPLSDVDVAVYVKNIKKLDYLELFGNIANVLAQMRLTL